MTPGGEEAVEILAKRRFERVESHVCGGVWKNLPEDGRHNRRVTARGDVKAIEPLIRQSVEAELGKKGAGEWGPITVYLVDNEPCIESPTRRLDSFDEAAKAEHFWPTSMARFQGESAEHWHESASFWKDRADKAEQALAEFRERLLGDKVVDQLCSTREAGSGMRQAVLAVLETFLDDLDTALQPTEEQEER